MRQLVLFFLLFCGVFAGWQGIYFASTRITPSSTYTTPGEVNNRFTRLLMTREDATIDFEAWDVDNNTWFDIYHMPADFPIDYFAVHWTGLLNVPTTGVYNFQTYADDGVRMLVGSNRVIEAWGLSSPKTTTSPDVQLTEGEQMHVRVDYFEFGGGASIMVKWQGPGISWRLLGAPYVTSGASGFNVDLYNSTLSEPFANKVDSRRELFINHRDWIADWYLGTGMPSALSQNYFAAKFSGMIQFPYLGSYRFMTTSDDGIRVTFNNTVIIDSFFDHSSRTDTSNSFYIPYDQMKLPILVEYYQKTLAAICVLEWSGPGIPMQPVGGSYVSNCGNGRIDVADGEDCDDNSDGCSKFCVCKEGFAPNGNGCVKLCGNGILDISEGEECDSGTGCKADCTCEMGYQSINQTACGIRVNCGDNIVDPSTGEQCESGGTGCQDCVCKPGFVPTLPISKDCIAACGNGLIDIEHFEQCDGGRFCTDCKCDRGSIMTRPPSISCELTCGNGRLDPNEECDSGLGCDSCNCRSGWQSTGTTSCRKVCGNGALDISTEECDGGSGCDEECQCKNGYQKTSPPSLQCEQYTSALPEIGSNHVGAIVGSIIGVLILIGLIVVAIWKREKIMKMINSKSNKKVNYFPEVDNSLMSDE